MYKQRRYEESEKFDLDKYLDEEFGKVKLTKKGEVRKRKPKQDRNYFKADAEEAILEYVAETDQDKRNQIYNQRIAYAFYKLVENIIHTFKFYYTDSDSIEDLKHEVITFLLTKLPLYQQEKGKAYSYFGTITKRYLIVYNETNFKKLKEKCDIDEVDEDRSVTQDIILESNKDELSEFMTLYIKYLDHNNGKNLSKLFPKSQDEKTADAIVDLFRKRESLEIFNKKALYIYIREITDVSTPQITKTIKKLKTLFTKLFNEYYSTGDVKM